MALYEFAVVVPFHSGDSALAERLRAQIESQDAAISRLVMIKCVDSTGEAIVTQRRRTSGNGVFGPIEWIASAVVQPGRPVTTAHQLFAVAVDLFIDDAAFLWLEPDCVLADNSAIRKVMSGFDRALSNPKSTAFHKSNRTLCVYGCRKTFQNIAWNFVNQNAVYRLTPELRDAVSSAGWSRPLDVQISEYLDKLSDMDGAVRVASSPEIVCVWHYKTDARMVARYPNGAASVVQAEIVENGRQIIHGDADGEIGTLLAARANS